MVDKSILKYVQIGQKWSDLFSNSIESSQKLLYNESCKGVNI